MARQEALIAINEVMTHDPISVIDWEGPVGSIAEAQRADGNNDTFPERTHIEPRVSRTMLGERMIIQVKP